MDRPNEGIAEAVENEAPLLMTCSGGTSVIKDLHTIDLARCVVDVSLGKLERVWSLVHLAMDPRFFPFCVVVPHYGNPRAS